MSERSALPRHRIELHGDWTLWRSIWVRAAGFPASAVLELAAPEAAAAADALLELDQEATAVRARAIEALWQLHHEGGPAARSARGAIAQLERTKLPRPDQALEHVDALRVLRSLDASRAERRAQLERAYASALEGTAVAVRAIAGDPRFREAMLWQNRAALHTGVDWLLSHPDVTNTNARQKQQLVASHLQRYAVKNDTIGFFGPISWGEARAEPGAVHPGRALLEERQVYFEHWAIDAVASAIAASPDLRPHLAPRLLPSVAVSGTTLRYGLGRSAELPAMVAELLAACDGVRPAHELARGLLASPTCDLTTEGEVYELLEELADRKLLIWTLEPSTLVHPDRELRRLLERIAEPAVRERALATLARFELARERVAAVVGDVAQLEQALEDLDATFQDITGQAATRRAGETYAARTLVYEDCVRDLSLVVGRPVLDRLGPVLALVAQSARWFTHEIATRYRASLHALYEQLAGAGRGPVPYLRFLDLLEPLLPASGRSPQLVEVEEQLARRWGAILELDLSRSRVELTAAALAERVEQSFAAPGPGWPGARHISPDVMIAARSAEDIERGEFTAVLGEVHLGNSHLARFLAPHGPDGEDGPIEAYEADVSVERVTAVFSRHLVHRSNNMSWSPRDLDLEFGTSRSWRPRDQVLRVADLVVEEVAGSLAIRDVRDGRTFDVIAFLEVPLWMMIANYFRFAPPGPHVPRVTIDGVVLFREQWRVSLAERPAFSTESRGAPQFAAARAWARALGLPRWVFVKIPEEPKPVYVDFESPIYVEMLAKHVRKASSLTITEMLPSVEETWIPDADGRTYTSELRMVMVDPVPWTLPGRTPP